MGLWSKILTENASPKDPTDLSQFYEGWNEASDNVRNSLVNGDFDDVTLDQYASLGLSRGDEIDTGDLYIADKMAWPGGHATMPERVSQLLRKFQRNLGSQRRSSREFKR